MRTLAATLAVVAMCGVGAVAHEGPGPIGGAARYDGMSVVAVTAATERELLQAIAFSENMLSCEPRVGGETMLLVTPEGLKALAGMGLRPRMIAENAQAEIDAEAERLAAAGPLGLPAGDGPGYFADYRDLATTSAYLNTIIAINPAIASRFSVGTSLEGRDIFGVRISVGGGPEGAKPAIWIQSVQHAREWAVLPVSMWTAEQLVSRYGVDPQITALLNGLDVYIVPIVNPDGYVYTWGPDRLWRKNRRPNSGGSFGVDLNRNWSFQWGGTGSSSTPSSETYRGTAAFSEPESLKVSQYIAARPAIRCLIDLHSNGQVIIVPWGYTVEPAPDQQDMNAYGAGISAAVQAVNGLSHPSGPSGVVLYLASGNVRDWAYGVEQIIPATIEVRAGSSGFTPPAGSIAPTNAEVYAGILSAAQFAATVNPVRFTESQSLPQAVSPTQGVPVQIQARALPGPSATIAAVALRSRFGTSGAFSSDALTPGANGLYTGAIPAPQSASAGCALGVVQYYFEATTAGGEVGTYPTGGAAAPLTIPVGTAAPVFTDNFDTNQGWTVGATGDTATAGLWTRADPVSNSAQPEVDNPLGAGTLCFITGNGAAGSVLVSDVDGGATSLTSPAFNGTGAGTLWASYARWFSNDLGTNRNQAGDDLRVQVSSDGVNYALVETAAENAYRWVQRVFRVSDFAAPSAAMRLRFVARDSAPDSCVESGVDDVVVYRATCSAVLGDMNNDNAVNFSDLNIVLGAFGQTGLPGRVVGDANGDGAVTFSDLNIVLGAFGT